MNTNTRTTGITLSESSGDVDPNNPNPRHYKEFFGDKEWIEVMQGLPSFQNKEVFLGALELQVRKYLDRLGQKGPVDKEIKKALFYLHCMLEVAEGRKISPSKIQRKL
jgi:hypothetical protein